MYIKEGIHNRKLMLYAGKITTAILDSNKKTQC